MGEVLQLVAPPPRYSEVALSLERWLAAHWHRTAHNYRLALESIAQLLTGDRNIHAIAWDRFDYASLGALKQRLTQSYAPATVNLALAAVKSLAQNLLRDKLIDAEQLIGLREVKTVDGRSRSITGRALSREEQQALLEACNLVARAPLFNAAIIALLLGAGLRACEATYFVNSDHSDLDEASGRLLIPYGKGQKLRTVYLTGRPLLTVLDWIHDDDRGGFYTPLSEGQLWSRVRDIRRKAKVASFSPHDLRRTYISCMLEREDLVTVQTLAGHANPQQTAKYDRRGPERLRAAAFDPWDGQKA